MPESAATSKKGLHPMAWVGIGCGGLLVVATLAVALLIGWGKRKFKEVQHELATTAQESAAEMLIEMNSELEMLSEDPETGEITVLVEGTGEQLTFSPEELTEGRVTFKGPDGTSTTLGQGDLADVPAWVPRYAGATDEKALFHREKGASIKGLLSYSSTDAVQDLEDFYDTELGSFSSSGSSTFTIGDVEQRTLSYREAKKEVEVVLVKGGAGKPVEATVTYRLDWPEGVEPGE
mgnify:CR=1 FL=1